MKRSRLRPKSKATAREDRQLARLRRAFVEEFGKQECHEIIGGSSRHKTKQDRRFWLAVTREEHRLIQNEKKYIQAGRKFLQDPEHFDLPAINDEYRIGGSEWPITMTQVRDAVVSIVLDGGMTWK